ncbi:ABC transporter ATP-binding protein [Clostridium beijerinckii]|uniref:ABC transporter ATP-binding protein n=1 Tax=Clostridium beijerinckii TaxID=1520 RepID=UPI001570109B|nr:ABC transporter ATP-binding protein [Clostridium beijerinckii]NRT74182.1 lipopolysaccharide transport system ATP-binding protein [Clostridium beijerinckii]
MNTYNILESKEDKIIVEDISKSYKMYNTPIDRMKEALNLSGKKMHTDFWALSNINFSVKTGEILGILGRNGAGKSTLLKIITGVLKPTYGKVKAEGRISSLLELGAGFNYEYSGIENIYFYGMLMKLTRKQIDEKIDEIIRFAEIGDYIHQPVKTYSSGMFARLAFSCAINVEPDILIVDEILSVGDIRFQAKCFNKFKEFKQKGVTILYVGHDVGLMKTFCDTAIWINNGKVVMQGEPSYVAAQYTEFMYLDEISEFTSYKKFEENDLEKMQSENSKHNIDIDDQNHQVEEPGSSIIKKEKSINHWGTNVGMIKNIALMNDSGKEINYFSPTDSITIKIVFEGLENLDYDNFSVAFSIKNKEGIDLIVKTTYDEEIFFDSTKKEHVVSFSLVTQLAVGEYYLVVALEDRTNLATVYYEYIEGAKYFKVYSKKRIFGILDPQVKIEVK